MSSRRIFINSFSGALFFFTNVAATFVLSPVIVHELGNRDYGLWEIMLSMLGYFGILDLGIGPAIVRYVAFSSSRQDSRRINEIFNSALAALTLVGAFCLASFVIFSLKPELLLNLLNLRASEYPFLWVLFLLFGLNLFVTFSGSVIVAYMMGFQHHYFINCLRIFMTISQGAMIYFALTRLSGPKLLFLGGISLGSSLLEYGIATLWLILFEKELRLSTRFVSRATVKELCIFGSKNMLLMLSSRLQKGTMPIVIGLFMQVSEVVFFTIPSRLTEYATNLSAQLGFPLTPYFSALSGKGDLEATQRAWFGLSRILQFLLLALPIAIAALGEPFLYRWMGPSYAEKGRWVIWLLSASLFVDGIAPNSGRLLVSMGRHGKASLIALVMAAFAVLLSVPLGTWWGVGGVAFAVMTAGAVQSLALFFLASRAIEISILEHLRGTLFRLVPPLLICALTFVLLRLSQFPTTYGAILGQGVVAAAVYAGSAWLITLTREERKSLLSKARATVMKPMAASAGR